MRPKLACARIPVSLYSGLYSRLPRSRLIILLESPEDNSAYQYTFLLPPLFSGIAKHRSFQLGF